MAGLKGNVAWFALGEQSAKGTPNTDPEIFTPFSGGSIAPQRQTDQLSETDADRDEGVTFVQQTGVEGSPELYVRAENFHHLAKYALGAVVTTGAGPYEHVITPATEIPYLTAYRNIGDTLWEQFDDCLISELSISADAGNPLTATAAIMGLETTRLGADPTGGWTETLASDQVLNFNDAAVTLSGSSTSLISSFECTISNNVSTQQTDDSVPYDVVAGQFQVTAGFDLIFEDLDEYNSFHYGGTSGTTIDSGIYTTDANFTFTVGTDDIQFDFANLAIEEFPVDPDPSGDAIVVPVRARAQRDASDPLVTVTVNNDDSAA